MEIDRNGMYKFIGQHLSYLEERVAQVSAGGALQTEKYVSTRPMDESILGIFKKE